MVAERKYIEVLFCFRWFLFISEFVKGQESVLEEPNRSVVLIPLELENEFKIVLIIVERNLEIIEIISPDSQVQVACWLHTNKSYSYCLNNPLIYTDPSGEFPFLTVGMVLLGGYIGGVGSNYGELNPVNWDYRSTETYLGIGTGMIIGGFGCASILAGTMTIGAGITTAAGSVYVTGSGSDWSFQWTTTAGGGGELPLSYEEKIPDEVRVQNSIDKIPSPRPYNDIYNFSFDQAKDVLIYKSQQNGGAEMMMYYFENYGYYFEAYSGTTAYVNDLKLMGHEPGSDWSFVAERDGFNYYQAENSSSHCYPYSLRRRDASFDYAMMGRYVNLGQPNMILHIHPDNSYLSNIVGSGDVHFMNKYGIPVVAIGIDGVPRGIKIMPETDVYN